jgi:hypothetical protein
LTLAQVPADLQTHCFRHDSEVIRPVAEESAAPIHPIGAA